MSAFIAALPMYDWPERRAEVDLQWAAIRDRLCAVGIDAPQELTRNITDLYALWRHPDLLLSQTCWGPMEQGLAEHVVVVGQQNYDEVEGGQGEFYSSAIIMRASDATVADASFEGLPVELLRGRRLAFNSSDSMSGFIALKRDLEMVGHSIDLFAARVETGGHRLSIQAVANGRADVATIDCMSWKLAQQYDPAAPHVRVVGWTAMRKGLPFVISRRLEGLGDMVIQVLSCQSA